jgi:anhydro-N-acetylmuramic acid kinase
MSPTRTAAPWHLVGVMSGTSLDGADAVLVKLLEPGIQVLSHAHRAFAPGLRDTLLALQSPGANEIEVAALAANQLADHYAALVDTLLREHAFERASVTAVAVHGQTIRHQPEKGYTLQLNAPARVAELLGINVICDFRSRDVAAGGHGAPLVPAFHAALFGHSVEHRAILNLGGMANVSDLPPQADGLESATRGWDTGPGNVFLDAWFSAQNRDSRGFDAEGMYASTGTVNQSLLNRLMDDPWFAAEPPKSTGRDHFNSDWLNARLKDSAGVRPEDVQATLAQLTAETVAETIALHINDVARLIVAGGGARNTDLTRRVGEALATRLDRPVPVVSSETFGIIPEHVEAAAFAWLGACFLKRQPGNRPGVTGARGPRVLGALYPA